MSLGISIALIAAGIWFLYDHQSRIGYGHHGGRFMAGHMLLGACNPPFAYKAMQAENKIGTMLPCNVVIQQINEEEVEIAAIDPLASMQAVNNQELQFLASRIRDKLRRVVTSAAKAG